MNGKTPLVLIGTAATLIASAIGAWSNASSKIGAVQAQVDVIQEREANHYDEIEKQLVNISSKLDAAPWAKNASVNVNSSTP